MNIAERLQFFMERRGVHSATQLAALSGVSQTMISRVLRGDASPTSATLELLCDALGVTLERFYAENPLGAAEAEELWSLREQLRRSPEMRVLFDVTKDATPDDLRKAVRIIEALKEDNHNG